MECILITPYHWSFMATKKSFSDLSYDDLASLNLGIKQERLDHITQEQAQKKRFKFLQEYPEIKAVTIAFTDLEGKLHTLDYDTQFLIKNHDALSFDGSSVRGFSQQSESDLRLCVDWSAFYILPADIFGHGKVLVFCEIYTRDGKPYVADMRSQLNLYTKKLYAKDKTILHAANEIEGFLFEGQNAEKEYTHTHSFTPVARGGYYQTLQSDALQQFITNCADAQRALGFEPEKNHPEVAPGQFEINYSYTEILISADQVQLYKYVCRTLAHQMGMTASFLPKPMMGVNGSGMHTNLSINKNNKNIFYDKKGKDGLSAAGWNFLTNILHHAKELCLLLNPSVNAYRRLDPHFEAPNQIKVSPNDRGSMIRIPWGNENSTRIEVRSVGPDVNPYMLMFALTKIGLEAKETKIKLPTESYLPDNIYDAIIYCKESDMITTLLGKEVKANFITLKTIQAERSPKALGTRVKSSEIKFHHEVTTQELWNKF